MEGNEVEHYPQNRTKEHSRSEVSPEFVSRLQGNGRFKHREYIREDGRERRKGKTPTIPRFAFENATVNDLSLETKLAWRRTLSEGYR